MANDEKNPPAQEGPAPTLPDPSGSVKGGETWNPPPKTGEGSSGGDTKTGQE